MHFQGLSPGERLSAIKRTREDFFVLNRSSNHQGSGRRSKGQPFTREGFTALAPPLQPGTIKDVEKIAEVLQRAGCSIRAGSAQSRLEQKM
jgi:hypothetical protein